MDNITRYRVRLVAVQAVGFAAMGIVLAGMSLAAPFIDRGLSQLNAHAAAFAAIIVTPLIGVGRGVILWIRSGRLQREMRNRGELP